MKPSTHLILLTLLMLPLTITAQHENHHQHPNSNALEAKEVNMEHSVFHLDAPFTTHRNEQVKLSDFSGHPLVVVMYYGNCTQVCPILIRDARRVFEAVDTEYRDDVRVLAVTFDPENDTPEQLKAYADDKNLNIPEWQFMTGSATDIRMLATMLGVEYSKKSDGHFAHSNLVTVLDGNGTIIHRLEGLNQPVEHAAHLVEEQLNNTTQPGL